MVSTSIPGLLGWYVDLYGYKTIYEALVTHADVFSDRPAKADRNLMFTKPGKFVLGNQ